MTVGVFIALSEGLPDLPIRTSADNASDEEDEEDGPMLMETEGGEAEVEVEAEAEVWMGAGAAGKEEAVAEEQWRDDFQHPPHPDNTVYNDFGNKNEDEDHEQYSRSSSKSVSHHNPRSCLISNHLIMPP